MLTARQAEVARCVARGLTTREIAVELGIAPRTVEAHIADAASRIPCQGAPRYRITIWFFTTALEDRV